MQLITKKIETRHFLDIVFQKKDFEIGKEDDFFYEPGDIVLLRETHVICGETEYTGRELLVEVEEVYRNLPGQAKDYCIFTFTIVKKEGF